MTIKNKIVYISWQPYCSRSDNTARELNGKSYMVYYEFFGSNYCTILFKYIMQAITTLIILIRDMPDVVFVMSPPLFACFPVYFYSVLFQKKYVIDAHTGAMTDPMWEKVMFLQKFFCRHAVFTILTNMQLAKILIQWNADYLIIPDVPIKITNPFLPHLKGKKNITLVNTFAKDEPVSEFLKAAANFPDTNFFVTGKINRQAKAYLNEAGNNVTFTGFLPYSDYYGLLLQSDIIIVLTTRDNTMQRGAYEAIYLGKPVITSEWQILKDNFEEGAIFVDNTEDGITSGIKQALKRLSILEKEAENLKRKKLKRWEKNKTEIIKNLY